MIGPWLISAKEPMHIRENLLHEFKVIPRNFRKFQGIPLK
jgi:hypothetical protein